jgi:hypothetical protein
MDFTVMPEGLAIYYGNAIYKGRCLKAGTEQEHSRGRWPGHSTAGSVRYP